MPTEDVVIRLRVDDSALRAAALRSTSLRGAAVVPFTGDVGASVREDIQINSAIAGGLAGNVFNSSTLGSRISEVRAKALEREELARRALVLAGKLGIPTTAERLNITALRQETARALADFDRKIKYFNYGEDGFPLEKTVSVGDFDPVMFKDRRSDIEVQAAKWAKTASVTRGSYTDLFVHQIFGRPNTLASGIPIPDWEAPAEGPQRVGGIFGPKSPKYKKPGLVRQTLNNLGESSQALVSAILPPSRMQSYFKPTHTGLRDVVAEALPLARSAFPVVSAVGAVALTKKLSDARSDYMRKVLVAGEIPESNYVVDLVSIESAKEAGKFMGRLGLLPLEFGMGLISSYNNAYESIAGEGANPNNRNWLDWEIRVDSTRQVLMDFVGANDLAYAEVERQQDLYYRALSRAQNAAREAAKRIGADIGSRLTALGLNNLSMDELAEKFKNYGGIEDQLLRKATNEFKKSNVLPSKRDVNPYWTADVY